MATAIDKETMFFNIYLNKKFYLVVESRGAVEKFKKAIALHPDDYAEIMRQIFDFFMDKGLKCDEVVHPVLSMLRTHRNKKSQATLDVQVLTDAMNALVSDIKVILIGIDMDELVNKDNGQFNDRFKSFRMSNIVLERLAVVETSTLKF